MQHRAKLCLSLLCALTAIVAIHALGKEGPTRLAQSGGTSARPNPEICTQCYEKLRKDYRDCETLEGQDWAICREAAITAYRRCSQGC